VKLKTSSLLIQPKLNEVYFNFILSLSLKDSFLENSKKKFMEAQLFPLKNYISIEIFIN